MGLSTFAYFKNMPLAEGMIELSQEQVGQLQGVLLSMLKDVDAACKELGVTYTMSGGSCLGAVRHHGFIPWDDDIDLNMRRSDLKRFSDGFRHVLGEGYVLQLPAQSEDYDLPFARVRKRGTVVRCRDDVGSCDECGAYIDIFIVDSAPSNRLMRALHGFVSMALGFSWSCRRFRAKRDIYLSLAQNDDEAQIAFKRKAAIGRIFGFLPPRAWARAWDRWNGLIGSACTDYVCIPAGRGHYFGETYLAADFFPTSHGLFEGMDVPLPANPDAYLKALYGSDYLIPPPESERERHIVFEFDLSAALETVPDKRGEGHE